jgi:hypothetical protein
MRLLNVKSFATIILLLICYSFSFAQNSNPLLQKNYTKAELNFLNGLESNNKGVRANGAYYLGEMKSQTSVSYLVNMMKYDNSFACRIVAALSLFKIGEPTGIQEVKMIREFVPPDTSSDKNYVFYLSILWNQYLQSHPEEELVLKNIQFHIEG